MTLLTTRKKSLTHLLASNKLNIVVVGIGRIGLPTALIFAKAGAQVIGVDVNKKLVSTTNKGEIILDEKGFSELLPSLINTGRFCASTNLKEAVKDANVVIVCVPTPISKNQQPEYKDIIEVSRSIGEVMRPGLTVIIESTVGPGIVENLVLPLLGQERNKLGRDFWLASCPERASPGKILENFSRVPRIVGGLPPECTKEVAELYREVFGVDVIEMSNPKVANAVKITENIFRDVNIALMNELAVLYEQIDVDIYEVIEGAKTKYNFQPHYPGTGVGGPCIPANPYYLIHSGSEVGYVPHLVKLARKINENMPSHIFDLVVKMLKEVKKPVNGSKVALLGVSYKSDIKDAQNSPTFPLFSLLKNAGVKILIYDPYFSGETINGLQVEQSIEACFSGADCIVIATDHNEFKELDFQRVIKLTGNPLLVVDGRFSVDTSKLPSGTYYQRIGGKIIRK